MICPQLSLNVSFSFEKLKSLVNTRLRKETSPLPEYLFSRSNAGASHIDIIRGLKGASHGILYARFFHMYPQRNISLTRWLSYWMKKGNFTLLFEKHCVNYLNNWCRLLYMISFTFWLTNLGAIIIRQLFIHKIFNN